MFYFRLSWIGLDLGLSLYELVELSWVGFGLHEVAELRRDGFGLDGMGWMW